MPVWRNGGDGREAQPSYRVHCTMDNRTRVTLDVETTPAEGRAEIKAGRTMLTRLKRRHGLKPRTLGPRRATSWRITRTACGSAV